MATQEGAARHKHYLVVSQAPDVCKSPSVPVPYTIVAYLSDAILTSPDVRIRNEPVFHMQSRVAQVIGNEAGVGGGVTSGVNKGFCRPITASSTVLANGQFVCRHEHTQMDMNCAGPEGPGNTVGKLIYLGAMVPAALGPDGGALDTSMSIAPQSLLDTLGLTPEKIVGMTNKAVALTQVDWDNPSAVLGGIGGLVSSAGFGDFGGGLSVAGKGVGLADADWSNPATALSALGVAGGVAGLGGSSALAPGLGCALGKVSKMGQMGLSLTKIDWSDPVGGAKGLMSAVKLANQLSGPGQGVPGNAPGGADDPRVSHLGGPQGRPRLDHARESLAQLEPRSAIRAMTAEDLAYLEQHNPPAAEYYKGLPEEKQRGVFLEVESSESGELKGETARIYVPTRGYSSSMDEQNSVPEFPIPIESVFVSKGGPGSFYEITGLESPPTHAGNYMLFGGLIDLGSPTMPGAGTGLLWFVPDRILGADMSPYFDYHDLNHYGWDVTLADVGEILDVEWAAFLAGISASGAGPLTMALQVVYSSATASVGMLTALWNSAGGLVGTIASLPSELSLSGLTGILSGACDSLAGGVASATSPSGVLGSCFGSQATPVDPVLPKPSSTAAAGTDGVLVSIGVSDAAAASALASMNIQVGGDSCAAPSGAGGAASGASSGGAGANSESGASGAAGQGDLAHAKDLAGKVEGIEAEMGRLERGLADGSISDADYARGMADLDAQRKPLQTELDREIDGLGLPRDSDGYPIFPEEPADPRPMPEPAAPTPTTAPNKGGLEDLSTGPHCDVTETGVNCAETVGASYTNALGDRAQAQFDIAAGCDVEEGCSASVNVSGSISTPGLIQGHTVTVGGSAGFDGTKPSAGVGISLHPTETGGWELTIKSPIISGGIAIEPNR